MTVEVQLQVADLDLRDPSVQDLIHNHLSDYAWSTTSGLTTMTVFSDGDVVADATLAIRCAQTHGIDVLRVVQEQVTYGEIARRIGDVSREAVRKWTKQDSFPAPRQAIATGARGVEQGWDWAEVLVWLKDHKGIDLDEQLPTEKEAVEINAFIHGLDAHTSSDAWKGIYGLPATVRAGRVAYYERAAVVRVTTDDWNRVSRDVKHLPDAVQVSELDYA